ncbi:MAG TPA: hypothetical protein PK733_12950 [Clostridiales bacterium]|nr:hypothetical protein [Clostridiales bacterium]
MPANDMDYWIPKNITPERQDNIRTWLNTFIGNAELTLDAGFRPAAADIPSFIDYHSKVSEVVAKIIIGELPVSAWDQCLEGWYKAGGEEYVKQMNEYIASRRK